MKTRSSKAARRGTMQARRNVLFISRRFFWIIVFQCGGSCGIAGLEYGPSDKRFHSKVEFEANTTENRVRQLATLAQCIMAVRSDENA